MQHGVNATRGGRLEKLLGISRRTLTRWRQWWLSVFTQSAFWKAERGRFMPPVEEASLPLSILDRFRGTEQEPLLRTLSFVSPLTTRAPGHAPSL